MVRGQGLFRIGVKLLSFIRFFIVHEFFFPPKKNLNMSLRVFPRFVFYELFFVFFVLLQWLILSPNCNYIIFSSLKINIGIWSNESENEDQLKFFGACFSESKHTTMHVDLQCWIVAWVVSLPREICGLLYQLQTLWKLHPI